MQAQLLELGRKYGQGAIFSYASKSPEVLIRETVPTSNKFQDTHAVVNISRVNPPIDWTGKSD